VWADGNAAVGLCDFPSSTCPDTHLLTTPLLETPGVCLTPAEATSALAHLLFTLLAALLPTRLIAVIKVELVIISDCHPSSGSIFFAKRSFLFLCPGSPLKLQAPTLDRTLDKITNFPFWLVSGLSGIFLFILIANNL